VAPEVKFANNGATLSRYQSGVSLSVLTLNFDYTLDHYSWDKVGSLSFGNGKDAPWENLHTLSLGGMYGGEINERWSYLVGTFGSAAFEENIDTSYINAMVGTGAIYSLSEEWQLVGGAGAIYSSASELDFGDWFDVPWDVLPVPVLGVLWNQEAESGFSASLILPLEAQISYHAIDGTFSTSADLVGQKADITYQFLPMLGVTLSGSLSNETTHRLAKDNASLPVGTKAGYLQTKGNSVELTLNVTPLKNLNINVGPYYTFNQELTIRDKHDKELQKMEAKDGFGGKFGIALVF
jgi:hypothetical protein